MEVVQKEIVQKVCLVNRVAPLDHLAVSTHPQPCSSWPDLTLVLALAETLHLSRVGRHHGVSVCATSMSLKKWITTLTTNCK